MRRKKKGNLSSRRNGNDSSQQERQTTVSRDDNISSKSAAPTETLYPEIVSIQSDTSSPYHRLQQISSKLVLKEVSVKQAAILTNLSEQVVLGWVESLLAAMHL